jgi:hypothetical protein
MRVRATQIEREAPLHAFCYCCTLASLISFETRVYMTLLCKMNTMKPSHERSKMNCCQNLATNKTPRKAECCCWVEPKFEQHIMNNEDSISHLNLRCSRMQTWLVIQYISTESAEESNESQRASKQTNTRRAIQNASTLMSVDKLSNSCETSDRHEYSNKYI